MRWNLTPIYANLISIRTRLYSTFCQHEEHEVELRSVANRRTDVPLDEPVRWNPGEDERQWRKGDLLSRRGVARRKTRDREYQNGY